MGLGLPGQGCSMTVDPEWMSAGLCAQVDGELWYPEKGDSTRPAKKICAACPVRAECLDYALTRREAFGVWGGLSPAERHRLLKGRVAA